MPALDLALEHPIDLLATLRPLVRGQGDRTIRVRPSQAWWTVREPSGPATVVLRVTPGRLIAEAQGPGAHEALERIPELLGSPASTAALVAAGSGGLVAGLARSRPGVRIPRTRAVLDALIPAILEQKITGDEARRTWQALVRVHGEPAPGAAGTGLRVTPAPERLAALPYHAFHPLGIERRRADLIRFLAGRALWVESLASLDPEAARTALQTVPGIGPWTAAEVAVRAFGDIDAVSVGDFHLPNLVAFALAGEPRADDARMLELLEPYRGQRALVVKLLELGGPRPPRRGQRLAPRWIEGI